MRICYSLWCQRFTRLLPWTGAIEMLDIKATTVHYPYCKNIFWLPRMAKEMRQIIRACKCCLWYEGGTPKAPLCPIVATIPLDLLHVDFTSIETTLEMNQLPRVANVLVFQDHFTKHVLAYVTPDQTVKTIAKFLYGGYISIFGAPARLLSDRGASFTSSIIEELCKILGIKWLWTMPYQPQTNRLVERLHQTIMHMIRKLGEDKKANWPSHLAEIVHVCNATQSAVVPGTVQTIWCSDDGPGSWLTLSSPPLAAMRPPQERPLPSMSMCMWLP